MPGVLAAIGKFFAGLLAGFLGLSFWWLLLIGLVIAALIALAVAYGAAG